MQPVQKKQLLREQFAKINTLSASQIEAYGQSVSLSSLPSDVMGYLFRAVEIKRKELLSTLMIENSLAAEGELREGEL